MNTVMTKAKKLGMAVIVAVLLLIMATASIFTATGLAKASDIVTPDDQDVYGWSSIHNGDFINLGKSKYQVVNKEARGTTSTDGTNVQTDDIGILVRRVEGESIDRAYSADQHEIDEVGGQIDHDKGYKNNMVTVVDAANQGQVNQRLIDARRNMQGTNLWAESAIRDYLNSDEFLSTLDGLNEVEQSAIISMPQQQMLWWGDANKNAQLGAVAVQFDPSNALHFQGLIQASIPEGSTAMYTSHTDFTTSGLDDADSTVQGDWSNLTVDANGNVTPANNDEQALRYTIRDKVFLPTTEQEKEFYNIAGTANITENLTRTIVANDKDGGSFVVKIQANSGDFAAINAKEEIKGIQPMLYLNKNVTFAKATADSKGVRTFSELGLNNTQYSVADLYVGDYITMGGRDWRVVQIDDNGIMVRSDQAVKSAVPDAARPYPYNNQRYAWNDMYVANTGDTDTTNTRYQTGSNFYFESDIRSYLLDDLYNTFSSTEKAAIKQVTQGEQVWFGERFSSFVDPNNASNVFNLKTDKEVLRAAYNEAGLDAGTIAADAHVNRLEAFGDKSIDSGFDMSKLTIDKGWSTKAARNIVGFDAKKDATVQDNWTPSKTIEENNWTTINDELDAKIPQVLFNDPIFIPSIQQVVEIIGTSGLKSKSDSRLGYAVVGGSASNTLTRTPGLKDQQQQAAKGVNYIAYANGKGSSITGTNGKFIPDMYSRPASTDLAIAPAMFLKSDTILTPVESVDFNAGEDATTLFGDTQRRTPIKVGETMDRSKLAKFKLGTTGLDAEDPTAGDELKAALAGLQVGQQISPVDLSNAKDTNDIGIPGLSITNGQIVGTPTTAGKDFAVTVGAIQTTVDVEKGNPSIANPTESFSVNYGDPLSKVSADLQALEVKTTAGDKIAGHFEFNDESMTATTTAPYGIKFISEDENWNDVTSGLTVFIQVGDQGEIAEVPDTLAPVSAVYGKTWQQINDDNGTFGAVLEGLVATIIPDEGSLSDIPTVGDHNVQVQFTTEAASVTRDLVVTITQAQGTFPAIDEQPATYGDNLQEILAGGAFGAYSGVFTSTETTVGNAGTHDITLTYTDASGAYAPVDGKVTFVVAKADRTDDTTQLATIRTFVEAELKGKIAPAVTLDDSILPAGFKFESPVQTGNMGTEVKANVIVAGTVSESGANTTNENFDETVIEITLTVDKKADVKGADNTVLIVVLVVVGVAAIGAVAFFVLNKKKSAGSKL